MDRMDFDEDELDDFLSRVDQVNAEIKGMKEVLNVEDIKTKEPEKKPSTTSIITKPKKSAAPILTVAQIEEQQRERERIRKEKQEAMRKRKEELRKRKEAEAKFKKDEERRLWWEHAEFMYGDQHKPKDEDPVYMSREARYKSGTHESYGKWDKWLKDPDDPLTRELLAELQKKKEDEETSEFERNNPGFCASFRADMEKRKKSKEKKVLTAETLRKRGNRAFGRKQFDLAIENYEKSLALDQFSIPVLTNMAQAYLRQSKYADVEEFCARALYVDLTCVKAMSRLAAAKLAQGKYDEAVQLLTKAKGIAEEQDAEAKKAKKKNQPTPQPIAKSISKELKKAIAAQACFLKEKSVKDGSDKRYLQDLSDAFARIKKAIQPGADTADTDEAPSMDEHEDTDNATIKALSNDLVRAFTMCIEDPLGVFSGTPGKLRHAEAAATHLRSIGAVKWLSEQCVAQCNAVKIESKTDMATPPPVPLVEADKEGKGEDDAGKDAAATGKQQQQQQQLLRWHRLGQLLSLLSVMCDDQYNVEILQKKGLRLVLKCAKLFGSASTLQLLQDKQISVDTVLSIVKFLRRCANTDDSSKAHLRKVTGVPKALGTVLLVYMQPTVLEETVDIVNCLARSADSSTQNNGGAQALAICNTACTIPGGKGSTVTLLQIVGGLLLLPKAAAKGKVVSTESLQQSICVCLANFMRHPPVRQLMAKKVHPIKRDQTLVFVMTGLASQGGNTAQLTQHAMAALINASLEPSICAAISSVATEPLLAMLSSSKDPELNERNTLLLSRCARSPAGLSTLSTPASVLVLLEACKKGKLLRRHVASTLAIILSRSQTDSALCESLLKVMERHDGVGVLTDPCVLPRKEAGYRDSAGNIITCGNAFTGLIVCCRHAGLVKQMGKVGIIPIVIMALKTLSDGVARKNVGKLIGRIVRADSKLLEEFKSLHGMEVLLQLGSKLV